MTGHSSFQTVGIICWSPSAARSSREGMRHCAPASRSLFPFLVPEIPLQHWPKPPASKCSQPKNQIKKINHNISHCARWVRTAPPHSPHQRLGMTQLAELNRKQSHNVCLSNPCILSVSRNRLLLVLASSLYVPLNLIICTSERHSTLPPLTGNATKPANAVMHEKAVIEVPSLKD